MKKKLSIILGIIAICIVIAGIVVTCTIGLNFDVNYSKNKQITIYIGKEFEEKDIKDIVKEVTQESRVIVQKVELYEDMVSIKVKDITDEQVQQLNDKINEKYELENKLEEVVVSENANVRGRTLIKPYILPMTISFILVIVYVMGYMVVNYKIGKKLNIAKSLGKIVLTIIAVQALYISLIAILRLPVNRLTIPTGIVLYVVTTIVLMYKLEKKYRNISK